MSEDALRNAFDLLLAVPPVFEGTDEAPLEAWCGAQLDAAAPKRKAGEQGGARRGARWADAVGRRRAFSEAWLALLRIQLPLDLYKARLAPPASPKLD